MLEILSKWREKIEGKTNLSIFYLSSAKLFYSDEKVIQLCCRKIIPGTTYSKCIQISDKSTKKISKFSQRSVGNLESIQSKDNSEKKSKSL